MADKFSELPYNRDLKIPKKHNRERLSDKKVAELFDYHVHTLHELSNAKGFPGKSLPRDRNKINDPSKLARLIAMIDGAGAP
jgi:type I restriction enzyme M protein